MHSRLITERNHGHHPVWPNTALAHAFLAALVRWVAAHHNDPVATIVLPAGVVTLEELIRVLRALAAAGNGAVEAVQ